MGIIETIEDWRVRAHKRDTGINQRKGEEINIDCKVDQVNLSEWNYCDHFKFLVKVDLSVIERKNL